MTAERTGRIGKRAAVVAVSAGIGVVHIPERLVDDVGRLGHTDYWRLALVYPRCSLAVLIRYQNGVS